MAEIADDLPFEVRPVPGPIHTTVYGHHHLITIGDPPNVRAVVVDLHDALRICHLLNEHGALPELTVNEGETT